MEIPDQLRTVYSATIEQKDGDYILSIPAQEIELGALKSNESVRVALLSTPTSTGSPDNTVESTNPTSEPADSAGPPVAEGETREVKIESIGDQGDGIAKVERGYVVIVPGTDLGETVTVEIENVRDNVSFATVVDRKLHQA
ncbi:TRAM domain-containing protein [Halorubrum sp. RMP-47]|uniref:TRAM domain-containing protein n=1 Tax=Halorubrum miltondacostae TaxID=3076378 RepID=UPI0035289ED0